MEELSPAKPLSDKCNILVHQILTETAFADF